MPASSRPCTCVLPCPNEGATAHHSLGLERQSSSSVCPGSCALSSSLAFVKTPREACCRSIASMRLDVGGWRCAEVPQTSRRAAEAGRRDYVEICEITRTGSLPCRSPRAQANACAVRHRLAGIASGAGASAIDPCRRSKKIHLPMIASGAADKSGLRAHAGR
jgi:hypothetical protein